MEIQRIEYGEVIEKDGIYDMPLGWYHSDCCDGPSVSSTGLRQIELETPLHYWDQSYLNPDRDKNAPSELEAEHFRIGRAGHWMMLEPELYKKNIAVRPDIWDSWRTKASQDWLKDIQGMHQYTVLTPDEERRVKGVAAALQAHPLHQQGILGGAVEASLIYRDKKTGIWLKSRPDSIPTDSAFTDLKLLNDVSPMAVNKSINRLGYDMQLALGGICLYGVEKRTIDQFWIVAVESKRPHAIHIASLSTDAVYWARIRIRHALDTMAKCLAENDWPAYGADGQEASPYAGDVEKWRLMQNGNLLPKDDGFVD